MRYPLQETSRTAPETAGASARPVFFFAELGARFKRPQQLLLFWNWKSAGLSILLRAPVFLAVASRHGLRTIVSVFLTECVVCATTAGCFGAIAQSLKDAEPEWLVLVFVTIVLPAVLQAIEFFLHWLQGTPHLRTAAMVSLILGALAALFNLYAMRRGVLLVGGQGQTFGSDLRRLPGLLWRFFLALPRLMNNRKSIPGQESKKSFEPVRARANRLSWRGLSVL